MSQDIYIYIYIYVVYILYATVTHDAVCPAWAPVPLGSLLDLVPNLRHLRLIGEEWTNYIDEMNKCNNRIACK